MRDKSYRSDDFFNCFESHLIDEKILISRGSSGAVRLIFKLIFKLLTAHLGKSISRFQTEIQWRTNLHDRVENEGISARFLAQFVYEFLRAVNEIV